MTSCTMLCSQLVRVMVSPVNSPGATASCQKSMYQCGLLQQLCTILMATGVPADILTEVMTAVLTNADNWSSLPRRLGSFLDKLHSSLGSDLFLSDHQHCIRGYQRLPGQPRLLCICQCSFKPTEVTHTPGEPGYQISHIHLIGNCTDSNFLIPPPCLFVDQPSWCCSCPW